MFDWLINTFGLLAIPLLVAINGFFVASEFALVKLRRTRAEELVQQNRFGSHAALLAITHLDDAIAATQLGITFASLALGWVGEPTLAHLFEPLFTHLPAAWGAAARHGSAVAVAFLLITYLHVVLGELAPKALALERTEEVALVVSAPLLGFGRVFRPFIRFMNASGNRVVSLLKLPALSPGRIAHSVQELGMLVEETERAGVIPQDQASFVKNVFRLTDKRARDVMVPREKVVTIAMSASQDEVLETARETAHTRMPVWEGDPDNIVGIVNTKDLFHLFSLQGLVILADATYPPLFVHPDQRVAYVMQLFRREKRPMAVVRDAAGAFLGIVTLEDILEEIVGEIEDEHDDPRWESEA